MGFGKGGEEEEEREGGREGRVRGRVRGRVCPGRRVHSASVGAFRRPSTDARIWQGQGQGAWVGTVG